MGFSSKGRNKTCSKEFAASIREMRGLMRVSLEKRTDRQQRRLRDKAKSLKLKLMTEPGDELESDLLAIGWSFVRAPIEHDVEEEASLTNVGFSRRMRLDPSSLEK